MAYDVPFIFNPKKHSSFDPNNKKADLNANIEIESNPYVPKCDDTVSLVKENFRGMAENYAQNYGMTISYWSTGYDIENDNGLYGENPTAKYRGPRKLKAVIDLQSYTSFLTKFGIMSDLDIVIYIPIQSFKKVWGSVVPLAGDLFQIDDSACDRPLEQSPIVFEITEKHDTINPADFMGGHYIWKITGKRYDNSYEPGAPQEKFIGGPVDTDFYGKIESSIDSEPTIIDSHAANNVDNESKEDFDNPNDSVYGKYF